MSVLIDTSIWSLALRRPSGPASARDQRLIAQWSRIVGEGDALLVGPVRQELLSGIRDLKVFRKLADRLADFPDLAIEADDYVQAASFFNVCRARGVTGSAIDLIICATAWRHDVPIFTTDTDFNRYARLLPIALLEHHSA